MRELPSPEGEVFLFRPKPGRVGLTADSPASFSPRDKGTLICTRRGVERSRRAGEEGIPEGEGNFIPGLRIPWRGLEKMNLAVIGPRPFWSPYADYSKNRIQRVDGHVFRLTGRRP